MTPQATNENPLSPAALIAALGKLEPALGVVRLTVLRPEPDVIVGALNTENLPENAQKALVAYTMACLRTTAKQKDGQWYLGDYEPEPNLPQIKAVQAILLAETDYRQRDVITFGKVYEAYEKGCKRIRTLNSYVSDLEQHVHYIDAAKEAERIQKIQTLVGELTDSSPSAPLTHDSLEKAVIAQEEKILTLHGYAKEIFGMEWSFPPSFSKPGPHKQILGGGSSERLQRSPEIQVA